MTQDFLDGVQMRPGLQEMRGEGMTQGVPTILIRFLQLGFITDIIPSTIRR